MEFGEALIWIGILVFLAFAFLMLISLLVYYKEKICRKLTILQCKNSHPPYDLESFPTGLKHNPIHCGFCMKYAEIKKRGDYVETEYP